MCLREHNTRVCVCVSEDGRTVRKVNTAVCVRVCVVLQPKEGEKWLSSSHKTLHRKLQRVSARVENGNLVLHKGSWPSHQGLNIYDGANTLGI